ncbi:MAG TPA: hypothetical protein VNC60_10445 [Actinomycetota bacterium]|nr:hypothetical protein [Actinomycetota bacterium]
MQPLRAIAAVSLVVVSCTGQEAADDAPPAGPSTGPTVISEETGDTRFIPGRFVYRFDSITANATFDGSLATLNVRNDSGAALGPPSIYVIAADGRRYDAPPGQAEPIVDAAEATLEFAFPEAVSPRTIGLTVLSFGDLNVGAMAPVPAPNG